MRHRVASVIGITFIGIGVLKFVSVPEHGSLLSTPLVFYEVGLAEIVCGGLLLAPSTRVFGLVFVIGFAALGLLSLVLSGTTSCGCGGNLYHVSSLWRWVVLCCTSSAGCWLLSSEVDATSRAPRVI